MRSNATASPCWARRIASASVISLESDCLVRVTVPVGTHPVCGMHPRLLELHLCEFQVLVWYRRRVNPARRAARPRGKLDECSQLHFLWKCYVRLELTLKNGWTLHYEFLPESLQFLSRQSTEERFQHDRGLPHACIQVVPKDFELLPGPLGEHRRSLGNILNDNASFILKFFNDLFKRMQFVKKTSPPPENYFRKQGVHV